MTGYLPVLNYRMSTAMGDDTVVQILYLAL